MRERGMENKKRGRGEGGREGERRMCKGRGVREGGREGDSR